MICKWLTHTMFCHLCTLYMMCVHMLCMCICARMYICDTHSVFVSTLLLSHKRHACVYVCMCAHIWYMCTCKLHLHSAVKNKGVYFIVDGNAQKRCYWSSKCFTGMVETVVLLILYILPSWVHLLFSHASSMFYLCYTSTSVLAHRYKFVY